MKKYANMSDDEKIAFIEQLSRFDMSDDEKIAFIEQLSSLDMEISISSTTKILAWVIPIGALACGLLGILFFLPFAKVPGYIGFISGALAWFGFCIFKTGYYVPSQETAIIERYGKFVDSLEAGWHFICLKGIVDTVAADGINLNEDSGAIRTEESTDVEVDFKCGSSAPIKGRMYFEIVDPTLWHYRVTEPKPWLRAQVAAFLKPILERRTLNEAIRDTLIINDLFRKEKDIIERDGKKKDRYDITVANPDYIPGSNKKRLSLVKLVREQIGVQINSILLIDIEVSEDLKKIRSQELVAEVNKKTRDIASATYSSEIKKIKDEFEKMGHDISFEDAERISNRNKDREAYEKSGANVTIVGDNIGNMLGSIFTKKSD